MNFHPQSLRDVIGQPAAQHLASWVQTVRAGRRDSECWLLFGAPATGKTTSALALAAELGCHDQLSGLYHIDCADWPLDAARELFASAVQFRAARPLGMACIILDNLEWASAESRRFLKGALDPLVRLPSRMSVVATATDVSSLPSWLLDRFRLLAFSDGNSFQESCREHLKAMWHSRTSDDLPIGWTGWGKGLHDDTFSLRQAVRSLNYWLDQRPACVSG